MPAPPIRRIGYGVTLACDPTGGTTFAVIGSVVDVIDGPDIKNDVVDVTVLGDTFKMKAVVPQPDPGEVTFSIAYNVDTTTTTLLGLLKSGAVANWQISYPAIGTIAAATETFFGMVSGFKRTIDKTKMIVGSVTIAVTGDPGVAGT